MMIRSFLSYGFGFTTLKRRKIIQKFFVRTMRADKASFETKRQNNALSEIISYHMNSWSLKFFFGCLNCSDLLNFMRRFEFLDFAVRFLYANKTICTMWYIPVTTINKNSCSATKTIYKIESGQFMYNCKLHIFVHEKMQ